MLLVVEGGGAANSNFYKDGPSGEGKINGDDDKNNNNDDDD